MEFCPVVMRPTILILARPNRKNKENSLRHLRETAYRCDYMDGRRVVFHPGVAGKDRAAAVERIKLGIKAALSELDQLGLGHIILCPETMGKLSQIGDLDETLSFCRLDERLIPCVDFGHLYARSLGTDQGDEATARIIQEMIDAIGLERTRIMHVHFSNIEYTKPGKSGIIIMESRNTGPILVP